MTREAKELIKLIKSYTKIPFKVTYDEDDTVGINAPFGEPSNENEVSMHINFKNNTINVGLYDMFNEHSIYTTSLAEKDICIDIARHIYEKNNY